MTLEQLRIFVAVAERQHMTLGARALDIPQSAASNAVTALENDFKTKLFNRVGRGVELTEAGRVLLDEARAVLARAAETRIRMAELGELRHGTLKVCASQTIASYWLPRHLMAFRHGYPLIQVSMTSGNTADVVKAIRDGEIDLGFAEGMVDDPDIETVEVARDQLILVVAPGHPWAERQDLATGQLQETAWVLREPGSGTRDQFQAALRMIGLGLKDLEVTLELPSNEAVRAAVEAGGAATVISASVAAPSIEAGLLVQVPFMLPERAYSVLRHRERYLSRSAEALVSMIRRRHDI